MEPSYNNKTKRIGPKFKGSGHLRKGSGHYPW